jgi:hypothetical protein
MVNVKSEERVSVDLIEVIKSYIEKQTQHSHLEKKDGKYFRVSPGSHYDDETEISKEEYKAFRGLQKFLAFHKK